jgi:hypothetical protein
VPAYVAYVKERASLVYSDMPKILVKICQQDSRQVTSIPKSMTETNMGNEEQAMKREMTGEQNPFIFCKKSCTMKKEMSHSAPIR